MPDFKEMHIETTAEPQVAADVVNSVPEEAIEHPTAPIEKPQESLESEAITRRCLIDYMLNEAGWEILTVKGDIQGGKACIEVKVDGISSPTGVGYCDYVLFSKGGKPLAVIEAKSTIQSPVKGRKQAMEYADCLEKKYGVRPVVYYTNGYTTKIVDCLGYPDREVIAFHSHDDLEYMMQKKGRADITDLTIDDNITNRAYQKTAIKSLVEWLNKKHRRGLLVLATGTGKTRVSISLCKLLTNNNWIKNVLFLADRTELVKQARGNYEKQLPSESMTSLSDVSAPRETGGMWGVKLHDDLKTLLHKQVASIGKERKETRPYLSIIEPFRDKEKWTYISDVDALKLKEIAKLIPVSSPEGGDAQRAEGADEEAKKFDVIMLHIMLAHVDSTVRVGQFRQVVVNVAALLEKKGTVPAVMARLSTITLVQTPQFWKNESLDALENVRKELRDLMQLLKEQRKTKKFVIDIEDEYKSVDEGVDVVIQTTYKQRVIDYLASHSDNATLQKIQNFEQLTSEDFAELERIFFEELGTREEYNELAEGHPYKSNVAAFIRVINGIDRKKALAIYQHFIEGYNLTSEQESYLKNILDYVSVNGDIETRNMVEFPLKQLNWRATFGDHFANLKEFIKEIHHVISA